MENCEEGVLVKEPLVKPLPTGQRVLDENRLLISSFCRLVKLSIKKKYKASHFSFYKNNFSFVASIVLFFLAQTSLVIYQYHNYSTQNELIIIARCCGILINFNSCLIILLVLKKSLTLIRNSRFCRHLLPIDDFLSFHKWLGFNLFVLSIVHTLAHSLNLCE